MASASGLRAWARGAALALVALGGVAHAASAQELLGNITVRGPAQIQIANNLVYLLGITAPDAGQVCTKGGTQSACGVIAMGKIAEIAGGKYYACQAQQFEGDSRLWGTCTEYDRQTRAPVAGADSLNRQLVRAGWAFAAKLRSQDFIADEAAARSAQRGLWAAPPPREDKPMPQAVAGAATVVDANSLTIAGVKVMLWGIDGPDLAQNCRVNTRTYFCGVMAQAHLIQLTMGKRIACVLQASPGDDRAWGVCGEAEAQTTALKRDAETLNAAMVRDGWAVADRRRTQNYVALEIEANNADRGLWVGQFVNPALWRRGGR